jgi:hypothetical protein
LGDVQEFVQIENIQDFRLVRVPTFEEGKAAKKQYMINVSEEDYMWFQQIKQEMGLKSKQTFANIRSDYESYNNTETESLDVA